jgi:hypothetical protein
MILLPLLLAANLNLQVQIPAWQLQRSLQEQNLPLLLNPGNPALPYYPVQVLLPMGESVVKVEVSYLNTSNMRENVSLDYVRQPQTISQPSVDATEKNPAVWSLNADYPQQEFSYLGTQLGKGYAVAVINLYPWRYNPVTGRLKAATAAVLTITTQPDPELHSRQSAMLLQRSFSRSALLSSVLNPEAVSSYVKSSYHTPATRWVNPNDPKALIIITSQNRMGWFDSYAAWKQAQGLATGIFAIETILNDYTGVDNAAKLRAFIQDAYLTWGATTTPLQYVILAGDDEIIPVRGLFGEVGDTVDNFMPSDLYYGCLDCSWNADGDNLWGEYPADQPDLVPEVYVGRFPAETQAEFDNIMRKTRFYAENQTFSNNIAAFFGENLNWNPVTWGGDYKDEVAAFLPTAYHLQTHYQRDGTYNAEIVRDVINSGAAIMNHMGHSNEGYLMGQSNGTIEALTNTEYGFLYSQGCYPAAFDQRTSGDGEAIGEHLLTAAGAVFAFIGNTRYGWYMPGDTNGPSQYYDRQFFYGMFQQNLPLIGPALEYSLLQNLNNAMQSDVMRWCYYETILFGDPSVSVKAYNPALPCVALDSYRYDDSEGDGDGNLNPGEIIRLYPKVRSLPGWGTAYNVTVELQDLPAGVVLLNPQISLAQLSAGSYIDSTLYIRFQLPNDMAFGSYGFNIHLTTGLQNVTTVACDRKYAGSMEITLLDSHFPWDCFFAGKSAPVVGDLQCNQQPQIMYADVFGNAYFINEDGVQVGGFDFASDENINRSFAVGVHELINTPMRTYAFSSRTGRIYAIAHKDTVSINYINYDTGSMLFFTPVIADLDNNGLSEVIAAAHNRKIYALNYDNQLLFGFPVELSAPYACELAVADLDNNNTREIIAGTTDGKLWVINADGGIRAGFPLQLNASVNAAPVVLNNNLIAVGTHNTLYLVSPEGYIITTAQYDGDIANGAIPVDLDRNGELDLVFVTTGGNLYALRQDGSSLPGFPVSTGEFFTCPPLAADIDSDNRYEIILQNHLNSIFIFNHNGTALPGFPFTLNYNGATPATLTDFDADGNYELISGYSNGVLVIKLRRPVGDLDAWTIYRGSLNRQGSFAASGFVPATDENDIPQISLEAAYPNPFNHSATITFTLPKADAATSLVIYNSKGQKVRTLFSGSVAKGKHSYAWTGDDDAGKKAGSGLYIYKLTTGSGTLSRKLLLLR